MPGVHKQNPALLLNGKLTNMLLSFAAFYKREIDFDDVKALNPTAFRDKTDFNRVVKRLADAKMVSVKQDRLIVTEFGLAKLHDHATYRREMHEKELARRGRAANLASKAKPRTPHH